MNTRHWYFARKYQKSRNKDYAALSRAREHHYVSRSAIRTVDIVACLTAKAGISRHIIGLQLTSRCERKYAELIIIIRRRGQWSLASKQAYIDS